LIIQFL